MGKTAIALISIALLAIAFLTGYFINGTITAQTIADLPEEEKTFTKAICEDNKCVDIKITCQGDSVTNIELISDVKEFSPNWVDPRDKLEKEKLCS